MNIPVLAILLTVAAAASAQQKCCAPDQFMGANGFTVGLASPEGAEAYGINQYGAWDFKNRRFGFDQGVLFYSNFSYVSFRIIQSYAERAQWFILDQYGYCEKQPIPGGEPNNCVPANATFYPGGYLGGEKGIFMDTYQFFVKPPEDPYLGTVTYSGIQESCFPIGSTFVGKTFQGEKEMDTVFTSGWLNVTIGIPEPDKWFKLPPYCRDEVADIESRRPKFVPNIPLLTQFPPLY